LRQPGLRNRTTFGNVSGEADDAVRRRSEDPRMPLSYAEAIAQATGPGQMFELVPYTVNGVTYKVFKNAPQSLREFYAFGRMHGDKPFVVYEDQRRSYAETMAEADAFAAALVDHFGIN